MKLSDLIDKLQSILDQRSDCDVLMYDTEVGAMVDIENVEYCKPENEHGRILEIEDDAVTILPWMWESEED